MNTSKLPSYEDVVQMCKHNEKHPPSYDVTIQTDLSQAEIANIEISRSGEGWTIRDAENEVRKNGKFLKIFIIFIMFIIMLFVFAWTALALDGSL